MATTYNVMILRSDNALYSVAVRVNEAAAAKRGVAAWAAARDKAYRAIGLPHSPSDSYVVCTKDHQVIKAL